MIYFMGVCHTLFESSRLSTHSMANILMLMNDLCALEISVLVGLIRNMPLKVMIYQAIMSLPILETCYFCGSS